MNYQDLKEAEEIMTRMLNEMATANVNLSTHDAVEGKIKAVGKAAATMVRRGILTPRLH